MPSLPISGVAAHKENAYNVNIPVVEYFAAFLSPTVTEQQLSADSRNLVINQIYLFIFPGESPLTLAAKEGHEAVVEILAEGGADVNKLDRHGAGPLHLAVNMNDIETVEILLQHRAAPNKYDGCNMTPMHIACDKGFFKILDLLLDAGGDPNEDRLAFPPLVHAVVHCHSECAELLLQHSANPNVVDARGQPMLQIAVANGDAQTAKYLIRYGAVTKPTNGKDTFMCLAALNGSVDLINILSDANCDPNSYREDEVPPLIGAVGKANPDCVEALLNAGVNVETIDKRGYSAFYNAVMMVADVEKEAFYTKYFSNAYRLYSKFDSGELSKENATKCAMSLVQAGANVTKAWDRFTVIFPNVHGVSFEQMVLCEVLIQAFGFQHLSSMKLRAFVVNLLNLKEYGLVKLLYSAGVDADAEDLYALTSHSDETDRQMFRWVKRFRFNPRQLKDLCRKKIRGLLNENVLYQIEKVDIPTDMKEYVCIMDTDHYSYVDET